MRLAKKPGVLGGVAMRRTEHELNVKHVYDGAQAEGPHAFVVLPADRIDKPAGLLSDL